MEIFRPKPNVSLFYKAVQDSDKWKKNNFPTYLIEFAIENGVDSSLLLDPVCGKNPLHVAVEKKNYKLVKQILKYATDHGSRNAALLDPDAENDETPFQLAIKMWETESMKAIFRFGLDNGVDALKMLGPNKKGRAALHYAFNDENDSIYSTCCLYVMRVIVTLARDNGVDLALLFQADSDGKTPLHLAACKTYVYWVDAVFKLANECGICAESLIGPDATGNSPLHYAAMESSVKPVNAILNFATDIGVDAASLFRPNVNRQTPFHCAAMNCRFDTVSTLLSWATSNEVPVLPLLEADSNGHTPLHLLATIKPDFYCDDEASNEIRRIMRSGPLSRSDRFAEKMKRLAAVKVHGRIARVILQSAVDHGEETVQTMLAPDREGQTPLHLAARNGHECIASVILQLAVEMVQTTLIPNECGDTPLKLALESNFDNLYTGEVIMRFAIENRINWKTLIDTKDTALCLKLKQIFYEQIMSEPRIWPTFFPSQSSVALSCSDHSKTIERSVLNEMVSLPDDVLFRIFQYLDALDLSNCEMVCHRWRKVLSRKNIWTNLPSIKGKNREMWQRVQKLVDGVPDHQLEPMKKCKMICRKFQIFDRNWKTGNYAMKFESRNPNLNDCFKYDDDYLLFNNGTEYTLRSRQFEILNRRTLITGHAFNGPHPNVSDFQIHGNISVVASNNVITVFDITIAYQVNKIDIPDSWEVVKLCFNQGLLVALSESSQNLPKRRQLTVWRVNSATDIQHLVDLLIVGDDDEKRTTNLTIDERYIAVFLQTQQATKIDFISTESLSFEFSRKVLASEGQVLRYHRGLVILQKQNCIRLMDVWTGFCREINLEPFGLSSDCTLIRANSKYLVAMNGQAEWTKVGIFDLYAAGENTDEKSNTSLCCFDIPIQVRWFEMDETELICSGQIPGIGAHMVVIDFLTPTKGTEVSNGSCSNDDASAWRFAVAKEILETLS